jgi:hypothetical protein
VDVTRFEELVARARRAAGPDSAPLPHERSALAVSVRQAGHRPHVDLAVLADDGEHLFGVDRQTNRQRVGAPPMPIRDVSGVG